MGEELCGQTANVEDASRLDLKCEGFWNSSQDPFFDVSVCSPLTSSYQNLSTKAMMRKNEREKQRAYEQRVSEVEHDFFTPLVFAVTGGMGPSASIFYKHLASLILQEKDRPYCLPGCNPSFASPFESSHGSQGFKISLPIL